jgi:hypothetical protein
MFYDGILKGKTAAHSGLITQIPDATMIKDDYEFINRERYETQYIGPFGDWLQIDGHKFSSLTDVCEYVGEDGSGTVKVIADAYVAFPQELEKNREITLDLNNHQVILVLLDY